MFIVTFVGVGQRNADLLRTVNVIFIIELWFNL